MLPTPTAAVGLPTRVGTEGRILCLCVHNTLCPVKMVTNFWEQLSRIERVTVLAGGATGQNGPRGKALAIHHSSQQRFQQKFNKSVSVVIAELLGTVQTKSGCR